MNSNLDHQNHLTVIQIEPTDMNHGESYQNQQEPIFYEDMEPFSAFESNFILSFQTQDDQQSNFYPITDLGQSVSSFQNITNQISQTILGESLMNLEQSDSEEDTKNQDKQQKSLIKRKQKLWTSDEDEKLKQLYDLCNGKWNEIAKNLPSRNASQCQQRWRRINPIKKSKQLWTQQEDDRLVQLVTKFGKQWKKIAELIGGITGKQARERFINKLDNKINKEPWSKEEDQIILNYYTIHGAKWTKISALLNGRPENHVKNRFYSYIQRNYLGQLNRYQIVYQKEE